MGFERVAPYLFKNTDSGIYYGIRKQQGRKRFESLRTKKRQEANDRLLEFLADTKPLRRGDSSVTFADVSRVWWREEYGARDLKKSSVEYRAQTLKALLATFPQLKAKPVADVDEAECMAWLSRRKNAHSPQRVNNEAGTLWMVFDYARRCKLIKDNPAEDLPWQKIRRSKVVKPSVDEFTRMIHWLRRQSKFARAAWFIELLAYSGMRQAEGAALRWDEIDFEAGKFTISGGKVGTKNREPRTLKLFPPLYDLLLRMPRVMGVDEVSTIKTCYKAFQACQKNLNLPLFNHHSMRHFFAVNLRERGVPDAVIAEYLGHRDGGKLVRETYGKIREEFSDSFSENVNWGVPVAMSGELSESAPASKLVNSKPGP